MNIPREINPHRAPASLAVLDLGGTSLLEIPAVIVRIGISPVVRKQLASYQKIFLFYEKFELRYRYVVKAEPDPKDTSFFSEQSTPGERADQIISIQVPYTIHERFVAAFDRSRLWYLAFVGEQAIESLISSRSGAVYHTQEVSKDKFEIAEDGD